MNDVNKGSDNSGSPTISPAINPNNPGTPAGELNKDGGIKIDYEQAYKELEAKLGSQGSELGEYRTFFQNISPLLEKLDADPILVQAILDGKIDQELAKAVSEGKVTIGDAEVATQAHKDVKQDLGKKKYESASSEEIEKMVSSRIQELRKSFEEDIELRNFEERTQKFIQNTKDFETYADAISDWLDSHDVTDIEVAYYAVKGKMSEESATKLAEQEAAERAKGLAQNAAGGGVTAQFTEDGTPIADTLISNSRNPNMFG